MSFPNNAGLYPGQTEGGGLGAGAGVLDNVDSFTTAGDFPATGEADKIYLDVTSGLKYTWNGLGYILFIPEILSSVTADSDKLVYSLGIKNYADGKVQNSLSYSTTIAPSTTAVNLALDNKVNKTITINGYALSSNVTLGKADVGLGNVDNVADVNKPVSIAQAAADAAVLSSANSYADAKVQNSLVNSTTVAPSTTQVNTALALKADLTYVNNELALKASNLDLSNGLALKINNTEKGAALGVATLDANQKIPVNQIPDSIVGSVKYKGTWNAATNVITSLDPAINGQPIPAAAAGNDGWYFLIQTTGTTNIDGITDWTSSDWIISRGTSWTKIDNTDVVTMVNGQTGNVTLTSAHINDTIDKRYVTDAMLVILGNTSGVNSGDETTQTMGSKTAGAVEKTTPVDTDMFGLVDSENGNILRKFTWANMKARLKTFFDAIYLALPASNGIAVRTSGTTSVARTIMGTANQIDVTNGDGVNGNPTLAINLGKMKFRSATSYTITSTTYLSVNSAVKLSALPAGIYVVAGVVKVAANTNSATVSMGLFSGVDGATTLITDAAMSIIPRPGSFASTTVTIPVLTYVTIAAGDIIEPKVSITSGAVTVSETILMAIRIG